jgi:hypothetical protein
MFNFLSIFMLPMTSHYFVHDHHVLQYKTLFNVTYLDENHASQ